MSDKTVAELMALAQEYAHAYSFVGDDTMQRRRAELEQAIRRAVDWQVVGHFVQRSGFGPWIEVAAIEEGATPLYRRQDQ